MMLSTIYYTVQRYCDEVLQPHILPMLRNSIMFQQNNARPHTAFFKPHNIALILLPSKSLDLNPMNHIVGGIGLTFNAKTTPATNLTTPSSSATCRVEHYSPTDISTPDRINEETLCDCYWCSWRTHQILNWYELHLRICNIFSMKMNI